MKTTEELEEIYDSEPYEWIALLKTHGVWVKVTNPSFIHGCHYQLIHIRHKDILEVYLADSSVIVEVVEAVIPNWIQPKFIENYNPDLEYRLKEQDDEDDRLSSDINTTVDNSVDSDSIVSKMTIPIIEVDKEMDREIDEYLSKQDGYREVRMVTCKSCGFSSESGLHTCKGLQFGTEEKKDESNMDTYNSDANDSDRRLPSSKEEVLNSFTAHGFETPAFKGEILKEVDGEYFGYVFNIEIARNVAIKWSPLGVVLTAGMNRFKLTPIKLEWYDNPANFPALLVWDSGIDTPSYRSTISKDSFIKLLRQGWKLATKEEANSLYCEG